MNVPDRIKAAEDVTFDGEKVPLIHNDDDLDNISNEQGVTNPKQLLNNGRETILEESITSASGLSQGSKISPRLCTKNNLTPWRKAKNF